MAENDLLVTRMQMRISTDSNRYVLVPEMDVALDLASESRISKSHSITNVSSAITITNIAKFILIKASAQLNVRLRQSGGVLQQFTCDRLLLLYGAVAEIEITTSSLTAVSVDIISA